MPPSGGPAKAGTTNKRIALFKSSEIEINRVFATFAAVSCGEELGQLNVAKAIDNFSKCLEIEPDYYHFHAFRGRAFALKVDLDWALKCFERGSELPGDLPQGRGIVVHCCAPMGRRKGAQEILNRVLKLSKRRYVSAMTLALIYIGPSRFDEAIRWIEKAYQVMAGPLVFLNVCPTYDPIRNHPRCQEMIRSMGLAR